MIYEHFVISTIFRNKVFFLEKEYPFLKNILCKIRGQVHLTTNVSKAHLFDSEEKANKFLKKLKIESINSKKFFKIINIKYVRDIKTRDELLVLRKERKIRSFLNTLFRKKNKNIK